MDLQRIANQIANRIRPTHQNTVSGRDFLRNGNRERLVSDWADIEMTEEDLYHGYSYAVIQKRGNKVASLAKDNLRTWAKPEVVDAFQEKEQEVLHPYLKLIQDSKRFTEKQFWKNISIYLDLAGRYYLGVVRKEVKAINAGYPDLVSEVKEFIMLNPYEIKRVINSKGELAGYAERKKDGRYREWATYQIIEIKELNPFDPDNSVWSMTDAAKEAVFTLQEGGNYTRHSLHANIDAPGIITTDVILPDEDFDNFKARVKNHTKGEPLFGNGTGAISWQGMEVDLDKSALLDINNMNREELFAVSGTSKTTLGIEQSGTTRETARVQNENFASDTVQPRLEDIIDYLNLDFKRYYFEKYQRTGFSIFVESAIGRDYNTETQAVGLRQAQSDLALSLIQAGYATESAYQYAMGQIELSDLQLQDGTDTPSLGEDPEAKGDENDKPDQPTNNPTGDTPEQPTDQDENKQVENEAPKDQGWVGARVRKLKIKSHLTAGQKMSLYDGDLNEEVSNTPAEDNPHFTIAYGLTAEGMNHDLSDLYNEYVPYRVKIDKVDVFEQDEYNVIVAKLEKTQALEDMNQAFLSLGAYPQEYEYTPHITLCYINKNADIESFIQNLKFLEGTVLVSQGLLYDNPFEVKKNSIEHVCNEIDTTTILDSLDVERREKAEKAYDNFLTEIRAIQQDTVNEALAHVTKNGLTENDLFEGDGLLKKLTEVFKKFWLSVAPIFGKEQTALRKREFDYKGDFAMTNFLKESAEAEAKKGAESHMRTIKHDILKSANKAYDNIVENAGADLVIKAYRDDPEKLLDYFDHEPTHKEALQAIRKKDLLKQNQDIYSMAQKMAMEGYDTRSIAKAIRQEYTFLSQERAKLVADNEFSRGHVWSQYNADYQFLQSIGRLTTAYKELVSTSGTPCPICDKLIKQGAIPFLRDFMKLGETLTATRDNRKYKFTANFEPIKGGCVHPRCQCVYHLVLDPDKLPSENITPTTRESLLKWFEDSGLVDEANLKFAQEKVDTDVLGVLRQGLMVGADCNLKLDKLTIDFTDMKSLGAFSGKNQGEKNVLRLNRRLSQDYKAFEKACETAYIKGEHSSSTVMGAVVHEVGHGLIAQMVNQTQRVWTKRASGIASGTIIEEAFGIDLDLGREEDEWGYNESAWKQWVSTQNVSEYAKTSPMEYLAEAFANQNPAYDFGKVKDTLVRMSIDKSRL